MPFNVKLKGIVPFIQDFVLESLYLKEIENISRYPSAGEQRERQSKAHSKNQHGREDRGVVKKIAASLDVVWLYAANGIADGFVYVNNASIARAAAELNSKKARADRLGLP